MTSFSQLNFLFGAPFRPLLLFVVILFIGFSNYGQTPYASPELEEAIEQLLAKEPNDYKNLNGALKPFRSDTIALNVILNRFRRHDYQAGVTFALNLKGTVHRNLSLFKSSVLLHKEALEIAESIENEEFIVFSLNMIGVVYRRMDAIKTALDYNQRALTLAESIEQPTLHIKRSINVALNGIGNLYQTMGQYDLAITQFERAMTLEAELNNTLGLAINNQNIGNCLEQKGELKAATKRYERSLALNEEINNLFGKVVCKNGIAQIHLKENKPKLALDLLQQLKTPLEQIKDKVIWSSVLINTGWAHMQLGNFKMAEKCMMDGYNMANEKSIVSQIIYAQRLLSELESKKGNHLRALTYLKEAEQRDDDLKNERNLRYINDLILRYEAEKRDNEISTLANENELVKLRLRRNQTTILVSALVIGLVGTILFIMYRQYQSNHEKKVLSLEQNMLRSQMNPHFLFNSLNSIKLYIINNDKKNAVHYLNKFSKLVRRILDGSSLKETTLAEELETVELYLNIENIRFAESIDHSISVERGINTEVLKIPSLVLQPFLENAIWHGLSAKEGEKKLWVNVSKKDDIHLLITIVDNGVGRAASAKIKEKRVLKRKSVGIDITKERLANFAKDYQYGFDVEIIDLYDDAGKAKGTKVVLEIPTI